MNFAYCPNCGQQNTVQQEGTTGYHCVSCGWHFWNNPKATVSVVFLKDGQVLVSERGIEPAKSKYDFPGGFLEYGENPVAGAIREVKEETGMVINEVILVDVFMHEYIPGTSAADIVYAVTSWQGEPKAQDDSAALAWKPMEFIDSDVFAWSYPGLVEKLKAL